MPRSLPSTPLIAGLALAVATTAVVFSSTDVSVGLGRDRAGTAPDPGAVVRLGPDARFSPDAIPVVRRARRADRLGALTAEAARLRCPPGTAAFTTWCLDRDVRGSAVYADAGRDCVARGGRLPTAGELIGAAPRVRLSSRLDDNPTRALVDPAGRSDLREMTSTLITTTTGSAAAGAVANPMPKTMQLVTVYDNRDRGGFAGAAPLSVPLRYRCASFPRQSRTAAPPRVGLVGSVPRAGRRVDLTVRVPGPGRVAVQATRGRGSRTVVLATGTTRTVGAGDVRIVLRPTAAGRRRLRPGRRSALTFAVRFRAPDGRPATATSSARVRFPRS